MITPTRTHVCVPCLLAIASVTLALALLARLRADEPAPGTPDLRRYDFEDQDVLGDTIGPGMEVLTVRPRPRRESLVRARSSYVVELLSSVEAL